MADHGGHHEAHAARRRGQLFVVLAAIAWSTAGVLQRELSVDTATQLAGRAAFAAVALAVFVVFMSRGHPLAAFRSVGIAGLGVAGAAAAAARVFLVAPEPPEGAERVFFPGGSPLAAAPPPPVCFPGCISRR